MRAPFRIALACALTTVPVALPAQLEISTRDKELGAKANPELIAQYGGAMDGPVADYVTRVARKVAVESGLSNRPQDFTVALLNSPVENAFAIPGGYVYVTRQLVALMNSEAELASVLGHEIGHVAARHAAKRNGRSTIGAVLAAGVGIATGNTMIGQAANYGAKLYSLSFSREQEYEADGLGVRYIAKAGYDPYAAAAMLASLDRDTQLQSEISGKNAGSLPVWARTHPNGPDRVERAALLADSLVGDPKRDVPQDTIFLRRIDGLAYGDAKAGLRISMVTAKAGDTPQSLGERMAGGERGVERFQVLNGLFPEDRIVPGRLYKLVVAR